MTNVEKLEHLPISICPCSIIPLRNLPPTSYARLNRKKLIACITKLISFLTRHRSGTYYRKIPREHINKLRQLIQRCLTKKVANTRYTRIFIDLLLALPLN